MSNKNSYRDKIAALEREINDCTGGSYSTIGWGCLPTSVIIGIVSPFVIWILLYFISPGFVKKQDNNGDVVRDTKKVFIWSIILTLILWVLLYLITSFGMSNVICALGKK